MPCSPRVVILAAGASQRLGEPKALVTLPGGQPIVRLIQAALTSGEAAPQPPQAPIVVTGKHHAEILAALKLAVYKQTTLEKHVQLCHNLDWQKGRTGSLVAAASTTEGIDLCILPVDHPRVSSTLLSKLFREWAQAGAPTFGWLAPGLGKPQKAGHPVVIGRGLIAHLTASQKSWSGRPLRDLRKLADPLWMLTTEEVSVHENLDCPEDLKHISQRDRTSYP